MTYKTYIRCEVVCGVCVERCCIYMLYCVWCVCVSVHVCKMAKSSPRIGPFFSDHFRTESMHEKVTCPTCGLLLADGEGLHEWSRQHWDVITDRHCVCVCVCVC